MSTTAFRERATVAAASLVGSAFSAGFCLAMLICAATTPSHRWAVPIMAVTTVVSLANLRRSAYAEKDDA